MTSGGASVPKLHRDGSVWVFVVDRNLPHPPSRVWAALTQADELTRWGPFEPDRDLGSVGAVRLRDLFMPETREMACEVLEAEAPRLLVYTWGPDVLRWELESDGAGTRLVLRHRFADRTDAPSYAAGWHLCLGALAGTLEGKEVPPVVGQYAEKAGWRALCRQYAEELGVEVDA